MVKKHLSRFLAVIVAFALSLSCLPLEAVYAAGVSESKYPTLQEAVSYTHLDVYKRQVHILEQLEPDMKMQPD